MCAAGVVPAAAGTELELVLAQRRLVLPGTRPFVIGRGPDVDLDLDHPNISREHLVLEPTASGWTVTDRSRNGTYHGEERITHLVVEAPTMLRLGGRADGVSLGLLPRVDPAGSRERTGAQQGQLTTVHDVSRHRITIGRLPDSDVVVDDLLVSRRHAELRRTPAGWMLTDLHSGNGTFVNGRRVDRTPVTESDVIGIGHALLQLDGDRLVTFVDSGGNTFEADGLTVTTAKGRTLLQSVSFTLPGKTLMAVIGPSGAGKSTLLNALTGVRPADTGDVRYADRDLYEDFDELRHRIALVPQDDVLHTQLTVRQALSYSARLRFPADTTTEDRLRRINEVLEELELLEQADQRITSLSGGQRKRTSVALELLTKPSLLFLDEPTSGLDPGMDRSVMRTLRALADDSRTVVVVTHNVANLEICDSLLLLAPGGWVAYFGPPADALRYFDKRDFADIFLLLATATGEEWARRFSESPDHRRNVRPAGHGSQESSRRSTPPSGAPRQQGPLTQFRVLCRRYIAVIASDRQYAAFLVILPVVLSLLAHAVPGTSGLSIAASITDGDKQPGQLMLVLVIGAALMGTAASVRELVKERPVYRRERAIGLSVGAYLASKVTVLSVICALQVALFTALSLLGRNGPDESLVLPSGFAEIFVAVLAVAIASTVIGLLISAVIDNADRGMPLLVLLIMAQLVLSGGLFEVYNRPVLDQIAWLVPARWGFSMLAATTDLSTATRETADDPGWEHDAYVWLGDLGLIVAITVALTVLIVVRLRRLDPQRRARAR